MDQPARYTRFMGYAIDINPDDPGSIDAALHTEWLLTNGLGSYAMGTALGANTRRYHGLLVAACRPPVGRIIVLHSMIEQLLIGDRVVDLSTQQFGEDLRLHPDGWSRLRRVVIEPPHRVTWTLVIDRIEIMRRLILEQGSAGARIEYEIVGAPRDCSVRFRPLVMLRDFHSLDHEHARDAGPSCPTERIEGESLIADRAGMRVRLPVRAFRSDPQWWRSFAYEHDRLRGQEWIEDAWSPGVYEAPIAGSMRISTGLTVELLDAPTPDASLLDTIRSEAVAALAATTADAGRTSDLDALRIAAHAFVVGRHAGQSQWHSSVIAGYPWFGDWGRDTMISLPGLFLTRHRFEGARRTLECFARHLRNGLIPNLFDDYGGAAHYNTVDASLWFVHAVHEYMIARSPSPSGRGVRGEGRPIKRTGEFVIDPRMLTLARDLRHRLTDAEQLMWSLLRDRGLLDMKFRRQHPIGPYIVDFYCHDARLVVEIDGGQHNRADEREKDRQRTEFLKSRGLTVLRYWNHEVLENTEAVLEAIVNALTPDPSPKGRGEHEHSDLIAACRDIIAAYRNGTDYRIFMDADSLISAGDASTQLTWMDAARDGVVFTPRFGKAVEINALWHNALICLSEMSDDSDERNDLLMLARTAAASFRSAFWWEQRQCLHDCLTPHELDGRTHFAPDGRLRPNQIFAASLPFSPLNDMQKRAVVKAVGERLLTPFGLRTLDRDDPGYRPRYEGSLFERDAAYHNGTVWPWLIGPFCEALLRVEQFSAESKSRVKEILQPLISEMTNASGGRCVGQIAEVYDGEPPHRPSGCPAQAWSIAEVLRALTLAS